MIGTGYLFNVRARINVAKLCRGGKFENLGELFQGSDEEKVENLYKVGKILNNEFERKQRKDKGLDVDMSADYSTISLDELLDLESLDDFETEVVNAILGEKATVEAEPSKKSKKKSS